MLSFVAQLASARRPEPAAALLAQVMGERGVECFPQCDQKAGKCPQFCAGPGWSGSCCRVGAVGPLSLTGGDQCGDRGCVDNHCCVDDASGDNAVDADGSGSGESAAEEVQRQIEETQRQLNEDAEKATAKALKEAETEASPDLESETHPQPSQASPVGDHRGVDCWDKCGQAPGPCFDRARGRGFCGQAGEWSGSCCKLGAVGYDQSSDCMSRGCVGFHCCVEDTERDETNKQEADQAAAPGPAALPEPAAPAEPAAPDEPALPGSECWSKCDKKAGKCPQFCTNPPLWTGSCCRLDATEEGQSPDCTDRGCVGSHCCVADSSGSGETAEEIEAAMEDTQRQMNEDAEKATAAEAKAAETASKEAEEKVKEDAEKAMAADAKAAETASKEAARVEKQAEEVAKQAEKVAKAAEKEAERQSAAEAQSDAEATAATDALDPSKADPGLFSDHQTDEDKRSIANWTRNDLRNLYVHARPSNNLSKVGLMVHCFDGTEDWTQPWAPCLEGECVEGQEKMNFVRWWSVSIINQQQPHTLATSGLILTPQHNEVLCSWDSDFGSMLSGCKVHNVHPLPPDKLKDMLDVSMSPNNAKMFGDGANTYNEVLVNSTYFWQQMPQSIAAFVYFDDEAALQAGQGQDLRLPDKIVAVTNYVKLLDYYKLSEHDLPLLKVNRSGLTFEDVSFGARKFLANHSYETYRKQNPYRKANPPAKVVKAGNGTAITADGALPTRQAGQEQQLAQERQAEAIGTNERVVSGELLKCRKLSSEQIIWNDRPCSRQKLVRSSKTHRAEVAAPVI